MNDIDPHGCLLGTQKLRLENSMLRRQAGREEGRQYGRQEARHQEVQGQVQEVISLY